MLQAYYVQVRNIFLCLMSDLILGLKLTILVSINPIQGGGVIKAVQNLVFAEKKLWEIFFPIIFDPNKIS